MKLLSASLLLFGLNATHGHTLRRKAQVQLPIVEARDDFYETIKNNKLDLKAPGILENDSSPGALVVTEHTEIGTGHIFQGKLSVYPDGRIKYDPKKDFLGTDSFFYTACIVDENGKATSECDTATVTITVIEDPYKPAGNPKANDDSYTVTEGGKLNVRAPGFLANDEHESDKPIYRNKRTTSPKGKIDTHSDGGFDYTAPKCWTGDDKFEYRVCYVDYKDMCDEATVTIKVTEDKNRRPNPAGVQNDRYTVYDGDKLEISKSKGVLSNDRPDKGQELYVKTYKKRSNFEGSLNVRSDGRVTYTSVLGKRGSFWFDYTACYSEWEDCVDCREAMVEIVVEKNPNKPENPPEIVSDTYEIQQDTELSMSSSQGVLANDKYDSRYSLTVDSYQYNGNGKFRVRSDGRVEYTPASGFTGTEPFSYVACYKEWPDLCASGTGTVTVKSPTPPEDGSGSRRGVATVYAVQWGATTEADSNCQDVEPRLTLSCAGEGELSLVDIAGSDNELCLLFNNTLSCTAQNEGLIYAECRDGRADNSTSRQLSLTLESGAIACGLDPSQEITVSHVYHAAQILPFCEDQWEYRGMNCSATLLNTTWGNEVCFGDHVSAGAMLQPETITMSAANYEQCLYV